MMRISCRLPAFLVLLFLIGPSHVAFGQQAGTGKNDKVKIIVGTIGHADDGALVLAVQIHAKSSESLLLVGNPGKVDMTDPKSILPFSMKGSYLIDFYTGNKIEALSTMPSKPYYGPMMLIDKLGPGQWIQMGVAFPKPPPPPDKEGQPQDYKFTLHVSVSPDPVPITYPADSGEASPPAK